MIDFKQRMETMVNPTNGVAKSFDNEFLIEKCKIWNEVINEFVLAYDGSTIIDKDTKGVISQLMGEFTSRPEIKKMLELMYSLVLESMWQVEKKSGPHSSGKSNIWNTIDLTMSIHIFAKFTTEEFATLLKPMPDVESKRLLALHAKFKSVDGFWINGLGCYQGVEDNEYYVYSYRNPNYYRKITI